MNMTDELIQEVKKALNEICKRGFKIADILKKRNKEIEDRANSGLISINELFADTNIFYYSLFESFWKLFRQVSEDIENPLIQPWIRVFIEQSCDIFLYSEKNEDEKKQITYKYWLCALGFSKEKVRNLDYDFFMNLLKDSTQKQKFLDLKTKGFPSKEFNKTWHELFSAITEDNLPKRIEKYFLNMHDKFLTKEQISNFWGDMSLYHHPNILTINSLVIERGDKSHIFRCFSLMTLCARSLIHLFTKEIIKMPEEDFTEEFNKKINNLIEELHETTNTN